MNQVHRRAFALQTEREGPGRTFERLITARSSNIGRYDLPGSRADRDFDWGNFSAVCALASEARITRITGAGHTAQAHRRPLDGEAKEKILQEKLNGWKLTGVSRSEQSVLRRALRATKQMLFRPRKSS